LVELLLVLVLLAILTALVAPVSGTLRARAEGVRCASNLRSLHAALGAYVADHARWPQQPVELKQRGAQQWWIDELRPYGMTQEAWKCPTTNRELDEQKAGEESRPFLHYAITPFDAKQFTPYRWPTQPWAIELGDVHGDGNLMLFPDGSIRSLQTVYRKLKRKRPI